MVKGRSYRLKNTNSGKLHPKIAVNFMKCHKCGTVFHQSFGHKCKKKEVTENE